MSDSPAKTTTEEVDQRHLDLAAEAGDAYRRALEHMIETVAHTGAMQETDELVVGIAQEEAEGLYHLRDGDLEWVEPVEEQNCHLEVAVADAADWRFVPGLTVRATLYPQDGQDEAVGPIDVPLVWHPGLYHYGANLSLPGDGTYDVQVEIDPAEFPRHDRENGDRYAEDVTVTFEGVDVKTGRK